MNFTSGIFSSKTLVSKNNVSSITVFVGVLFLHQPNANHTPEASVTQVNHSVYYYGKNKCLDAQSKN